MMKILGKVAGTHIIIGDRLNPDKGHKISKAFWDTRQITLFLDQVWTGIKNEPWYNQAVDWKVLTLQNTGQATSSQLVDLLGSRRKTEASQNSDWITSWKPKLAEEVLWKWYEWSYVSSHSKKITLNMSWRWKICYTKKIPYGKW